MPNTIELTEEIPSTPLISKQTDASTFKTVLPVAVLIIFSVIINTFVGTFSGEKMRFLLKDALHLSANGTSTLGIIAGIPGYLRPFMGATADLFPLFGFRRRTYYALSWLLISLAYFALAHMIAFHYVAVVLALIVTGLGGNLLFVIMDAVMVAIGNATASVGRLQALQQGIPLFIMAFVAHMKGYVTQHWSYSHCFTASALVALIGIPVAFLIQEKSTKAHRSEHLTESDRQAHHEKLKADKSESLAALKLAIKSPGLWAVVGFVFYLIFTPGINTAQFYYMTGPLHFSAQFIGSLDSYSSAGSIIALLLFSVLSKKIPVHSMVWGAFLMDCSVYLIMMLLKDENSAKYVTLIYAIVGMIYNLCLVTLAARACPPKIEGAIYGLVLSAIALAGAFGEKLGSAMYDYFGPASHHSIVHGWYSLLIWGFVFTALAVVFIPFLPKWTKSREPLTAAISS